MNSNRLFLMQIYIIEKLFDGINNMTKKFSALIKLFPIRSNNNDNNNKCYVNIGEMNSIS